MAAETVVLNTIDEALDEIRQGKLLIVIDDEERGNEGDFVAAAEKVTPEIINFLVKEGREVVCAPLTAERASGPTAVRRKSCRRHRPRRRPRLQWSHARAMPCATDREDRP